MDAAAVLQRLDAGSLQAIFQNTPGRVEQPTVQCVQIKPMTSSNGEPSERYRVVFSDGKNYVQTMLATQLNGEIHEGRLKRGVIVQLLTYQANNVRGKRILIVTSIHVFAELGEHDKLGDPVMMEIKDEGTTDTITSNGFYGQKQQPEQQQSRSMPSHTKPPSSSASHANIYPIEGLSPFSHKWTIKARCTNKSEIKTWHNRNGEGQLFNVNLLDDSGEIRATGFNDQCKQLYDVFQEGSVYYISSPARIQMAKKQYSNVNNDYEITFERDTVVEKADAQDDVPQVRFNFTQISDLNTVDKDTTVDVVGVLKDISEVSQITSKTTSKPYEKRELTLVDDTNYSVRLTVWGKTASTFEVSPESVVAFKGVKVSDFGGRSLSLLSSGSMTVNPDLPDAHRLRGWYDHAGQGQNFATHANVTGTAVPGGKRRDATKTCAAVKDESLGQSDSPDFFDLKASIQYIKQEATFCYAACRSEGCSKKVTEIEPGQWRCEKCNVVHERPEYRYILKMNVSDHTGQLWLSCFDEVGRMIMGMSADELMEIQENGEENGTRKLGEIFAEANYKMYNFKCLAKMDSYQDNQTIRYQVRSAVPLDFAAESQKLAAMIKQYENMSV